MTIGLQGLGATSAMRAMDVSDVMVGPLKNYEFMTRKGHIVSEGETGRDDDEALKLLIVTDSLSRAVFAHAVSKKGIDEKRLSVDAVVDDVLWIGYAKVIPKSDNEPAIVKLLKEALSTLRLSGVDQG